MAFTEEEFRKWHAEKQKREYRPSLKVSSPPVAECVVCQNPFGVSEGTITDEVAICDVCNGD